MPPSTKQLAILLAGLMTICIFLLYIFVDTGGGAASSSPSRTGNNGSSNLLMGKINEIKTSAPPRYSLAQMREFAFKNAMANEFKHPMMHNQQRTVSFNQIVENYAKNRYQIDGQDVIVFLHIQKTAGTTFENFLVRRLNVTHPCKCDLGKLEFKSSDEKQRSKKKKKCLCRRPGGRVWLFSRFSTGWACGLHADYSELIASNCVGQKLDTKEGKHHQRRLYLTTFLREPVDRFISEYSHVSYRGATWAKSRHTCGGRQPTPDELPMCFDPEVGWTGVDLDEQTRMLADLTLVHCYNSSAMDPLVRDGAMLESAKRNLRQFAFFGLKEHMRESQFLFEQTLGLRFDGNLAEWNRSKSAHVMPSEAQLALIRRRNALDLALYEFARRLFGRRLTQLGWNTTTTTHDNNNSSF